MVTKEFAEASAEINEILKYLPEEYINKIPSKLRDFFEKVEDKEYIAKEDLLDKQLILPQRLNVQSELANWFGKDFNKLHVSFTSNLGTNAGVMAIHGLGYPVSIEGATKYWGKDLLVQRRLYPEITASTVIAWRRNIPYSLAMNKFIEEINAFKA